MELEERAAAAVVSGCGYLPDGTSRIAMTSTSVDVADHIADQIEAEIRDAFSGALAEYADAKTSYQAVQDELSSLKVGIRSLHSRISILDPEGFDFSPMNFYGGGTAAEQATELQKLLDNTSGIPDWLVDPSGGYGPPTESEILPDILLSTEARKYVMVRLHDMAYESSPWHPASHPASMNSLQQILIFIVFGNR